MSVPLPAQWTHVFLLLMCVPCHECTTASAVGSYVVASIVCFYVPCFCVGLPAQLAFTVCHECTIVGSCVPAVNVCSMS